MAFNCTKRLRNTFAWHILILCAICVASYLRFCRFQRYPVRKSLLVPPTDSVVLKPWFEHITLSSKVQNNVHLKEQPKEEILTNSFDLKNSSWTCYRDPVDCFGRFLQKKECSLIKLMMSHLNLLYQNYTIDKQFENENFDQKTRYAVIIPYCNSASKQSARASQHLRTTVTSLLYSATQAMLHVRIVIVELCEKKSDFSLLNITHIYKYEKAKTKGFRKAYAFNLGFLVAGSKWNILHDAEVVVPGTFFSGVLQMIGKGKGISWFQPYSNRKVGYIDHEMTQIFFNLLPQKGVANAYHAIDKTADRHFGPAGLTGAFAAGAPGGSIAVNANIFCTVGGFDATLFVGYGPEDSFFWEKLKVLQDPLYMDKPRTNLYHLDHDRMSYNAHMANPLHRKMLDYLFLFQKSPKEFKALYLRLASMHKNFTSSPLCRTTTYPSIVSTVGSTKCSL